MTALNKPFPHVSQENLLERLFYKPYTPKQVRDLNFIDPLTNDEEDPPLESDWHVASMALLVGILRDYWAKCDDIYVSGNTVVRFDPSQRRKCRGPDLYIVKGVIDNGFRRSWISWEENNLTPNFILELTSVSTAEFDVTGKKTIYEQELKTPEYMVYNPETEELKGWRFDNKNHYQTIMPNQEGRLWCDEIGLWLGIAEYQFFKNRKAVKTPRFFDSHGQLILTRDEAETQRADKETQARRKAEAEITRLKALLEGKL